MEQKKRTYTGMGGTVQSVALDTLMPLIRERLAAGQAVELSPRGISMQPMLREGRDTVILSAVTAPLRRFDIPLYQREDGSFVLHRIVRIEDGAYICIGDNQFRPEERVRDAQIIAVVTAYRRGGRLRSLTSLGYRLYCRRRCGLRPLRYFLSRTKSKLKRLLNKRK